MDSRYGKIRAANKKNKKAWTKEGIAFTSLDLIERWQYGSPKRQSSSGVTVTRISRKVQPVAQTSGMLSRKFIRDHVGRV